MKKEPSRENTLRIHDRDVKWNVSTHLVTLQINENSFIYACWKPILQQNINRVSI